MNTLYLSSPAGRCANGLLAFALIAAGALGIAGPGPHVTLVMAWVPVIAIVAGLFSVGLALDRFGGHALALTLGMPPLGGLYLGLLATVPSLGSAFGVLLVALAAPPGWLALTGGRWRGAGGTRVGRAFEPRAVVET